jgi:hypothetical protein
MKPVFDQFITVLSSLRYITHDRYRNLHLAMYIMEPTKRYMVMIPYGQNVYCSQCMIECSAI